MSGSQKPTKVPPGPQPVSNERPDDWHRAVDSLPEHVALLDRDWNIIATNRAWESATKRLGFDALRKGGNYRAVAKDLADRGHAPSVSLFQAMEQFDSGERQRYRCVCPGEGPKRDRTFETIITVSEAEGQRLYAITRHDLSEIHRLKADRRALGSQLL